MIASEIKPGMGFRAINKMWIDFIIGVDHDAFRCGPDWLKIYIVRQFSSCRTEVYATNFQKISEIYNTDNWDHL